MRRYLARRIAQAVGVLLAAYTVSFAVLYLLPSDPVAILAGGGGGEAVDVDPAELDRMREEYGFDDPLPIQFVTQLGKALTGDLGSSVQTGQSVTAAIAEALPPTLALTGAALVLAVVAGAALAIASTWTRWRWLGELLASLPPMGVAMPTFWVGLVLVDLFSFRIGLFPAFGSAGIDSLVLPAVTLAVPAAAMLAQVFIKSLRHTLSEPYIESARARGLDRRTVHLSHAVRNAVLPALTVVGVLVGGLLTSAVVVETVFSRNGVGRLTATAVSAQDIPVVQGVVMLGAAVFVLSNLLVDLLYPVLDPRIVSAAHADEKVSR